jgi:hypothetical protein
MYKIFSIIYLIVGVMVMVWLLQVFSETPEFNFYKYFTLTKDGILTSHRDTVHPAASIDAYILAGKSFGDESGRVTDSSKVTYQQQLDETIASPPTAATSAASTSTPINSHKNTNDDVTSLNTSINATGHNYMSLASIQKS